MSRPLDWLDRELPVPQLTEHGRTRRAAMRAVLQGAVRRRRRRRQASRAAGVLALGFLAILFWPRADGASPTAPPALRHLVYDTIGNDPTVLERYAASPAVRPETRIGDDELLELLASDNRRTGLIRIGGRLILTEDVTDELPN